MRFITKSVGIFVNRLLTSNDAGWSVCFMDNFESSFTNWMSSFRLEECSRSGVNISLSQLEHSYV